MNLWDEANELDNIANQLSCLGNVLELLAEKMTENPESGTLWLCRDVCENLTDRLNDRVANILKIDRKQSEENCYEAEFVKNAKIKDMAGEE